MRGSKDGVTLLAARKVVNDLERYETGNGE